MQKNFLIKKISDQKKNVLIKKKKKKLIKNLFHLGLIDGNVQD